MPISPRSIFAIVFIVIGCSRRSVLAQEANDNGRPTVIVHVYNNTKMPASELAETGTYVREIFEKAGIEVVWLDSMSRVGAHEPDPLNHGWAEGSGRHVSLAIIPKPGAVGPKGRNAESALGWTPSDQRGRTYVFYERVEALVLNSFPRLTLRAPRVLAYAAAHELGHLLIPLANSHSEKGIMKAQLDRNDLAELFSGSLGFSGKEAELIARDLKQQPSIPAVAR